MSSLKFTEGFIFSEDLISAMLQMVRDSRFHAIEYGAYLYKKRGLIYPDRICKGTHDEIIIRGDGNIKTIGRFHTHPRSSFEESANDYIGMLYEVVENKHHIECIYGYNEAAIKCVAYHSTPEQIKYINKYLPLVKDEDSFQVKFSGLVRKLTVSTNVYTIKELEGFYGSNL